MDTFIAILALLIGLAMLTSLWRERKFIEIRFRFFKLRDEILWMALDGHITKEQAIFHYNNLNWAVRYVREYPVFFLFGLAMAFQHLNIPENREELEQILRDMPDELKDWYFRLSELTLEGIRTYTPLDSPVTRLFDSLGFRSVIAFFMPLWLCLKLVSLRRHPLRRRFNFAKARKESQALYRTRNTAGMINGLRPSPAH